MTDVSLIKPVSRGSLLGGNQIRYRVFEKDADTGLRKMSIVMPSGDVVDGMYVSEEGYQRLQQLVQKQRINQLLPPGRRIVNS